MSNFDTDPPLVPAPLITTPAPPPNRVLFGPLGLRAGWGILLYLLVAAMLTAGLYFGLAAGTGKLASFRAKTAQASVERAQARATHTPVPVHPMHVSDTLIGESAMSAVELLAALSLCFLERRRFAAYGAGLPHLRDLLPGAAWGLAAMGLLVGLLRALHLIAFDGELQHGTAAFDYGAAWLLMFFLVGLSEEFLFRGYLQFTLMRGLLGLSARVAPDNARRTAYLLSGIVTSLLFFAAHTGNPGENHTGLLGVFLAGVLFCYALWRTGSLWWGIGFHMTWDWTQSFLFGTADSGTIAAGRLLGTHPLGNPLLSGGPDGPEGSLLLLPILLLIILVLRLHPKAALPSVLPTALPAGSDAHDLPRAIA